MTTKSGLSHSCPDGTHSRLNRTGPVGTQKGVRFSCPRCGWSNSAVAMQREYDAVRPLIVAALSR